MTTPCLTPRRTATATGSAVRPQWRAQRRRPRHKVRQVYRQLNPIVIQSCNLITESSRHSPSRNGERHTALRDVQSPGTARRHNAAPRAPEPRHRYRVPSINVRRGGVLSCVTQSFLQGRDADTGEIGQNIQAVQRLCRCRHRAC